MVRVGVLDKTGRSLVIKPKHTSLGTNPSLFTAL